MRSSLFTKNQTKPLMKHGNVLKDSFINVLTMAFRTKTPPTSILMYNSLNSIRSRCLNSAAVDPLPSPNQGDYLPGIQKDLKVGRTKKSSLEYATSYEPKRLNLSKSDAKRVTYPASQVFVS
ncbi:hypothetical protein Tco_0527276 [Tanacetum coccineum]